MVRSKNPYENGYNFPIGIHGLASLREKCGSLPLKPAGVTQINVYENWVFNPFRPRSPIFLKLSELVDLSPNKKSEAQFCSNSRWRREIPNWNFEIATFLERSQRRTLIDKILILFAKDSQVCLLWAVKFTGINSNSLASRFHFYFEPSKISIFSNWPTLEQPIL